MQLAGAERAGGGDGPVEHQVRAGQRERAVLGAGRLALAEVDHDHRAAAPRGGLELGGERERRPARGRAGRPGRTRRSERLGQRTAGSSPYRARCAASDGPSSTPASRAGPGWIAHVVGDGHRRAGRSGSRSRLPSGRAGVAAGQPRQPGQRGQQDRPRRRRAAAAHGGRASQLPVAQVGADADAVRDRHRPARPGQQVHGAPGAVPQPRAQQAGHHHQRRAGPATPRRARATAAWYVAPTGTNACHQRMSTYVSTTADATCTPSSTTDEQREVAVQATG